MTSRHSEQQVYVLSNAGDASETFEHERWSVTVKAPDDLVMKLRAGTPIVDYKMPVLAVADEPGPVEDVPWTDPHAMLVSDRLRSAIEELAPGHAQFLAASVEYSGKPVKGVKYWLVNWLHLVDCLDWMESEYSILKSKSHGVQRIAVKKVVDTKKISKNILVCRIVHAASTVLVRRALRTELEKLGFTGLQFYTIDQHD